MKRKLFVVGNPASGTKKLEVVLRELIDFIAAKKWAYTVFLTSKSHNGWVIIEQNLDETYTDLVILGGDGTINECVNALKHNVPVSIIPTGSGNDFVKMLDIGDSLEDHLQVLDHGKIVQVDVGVCNGRKFVNGVGMGFDGQIVLDMAHRKSILRGALKYYYYVLRILGFYKSRRFNYKIDDESFSEELILLCVANGSTFGGSFMLTPEADLQDGKLEVCEIQKLSGLKRFLNIHRMKKGTHGKMKEVRFYQATTVKVEANNHIAGHIDGELFGNPPYEFSILPKALSVRVRI